SANFLTQLGNPFREPRPVTFPRDAAYFELLALAVDRLGDVRIIDAPQKFLGEFDVVGIVALGFLARSAGGILIQRLHYNGKIGTGLRVVKPNNHVASVHAIALLHQEFADDATGRVLNFFHIRAYDELSLRDHRARELGGCSPSSESEHQNDG